MSKRKKRFECGHYGLGKFCHQCNEKEKEREEKKMEKERKIMYIANNGRYISNIPYKVQKKAVVEFKKLNAAKRIYTNQNAKRLTALGQRNIVVLRVGNSWRLICAENENGFEWIDLLSHETYNNKLKMGGWK